MKKIIFAVLIAFALILVVLSCKKNQNDLDTLKYTSYQITDSNQNIEKLLLSFKSSIESGLKTSYSYPIDTAVRYIEGLLNYTYGDISNNLQGVYMGSIQVEADLNEGKITPSEVNSTYQAIIDSLTIQFENLPTQNLHLVFADVFRQDSTNGIATLGVTSFFAFGSPLDGDHFEEDDYWMYGFREINAGGYCDGPNFGNNTDEDAASKIRDQVRLGMGVLPARHYTMDIIPAYIFDNLVIIPTYPTQYFDYEFLNPNDDVPGDNMYDYLLLKKWSDIVPFDTCLTPTEMNFYTYGAEQILYDDIYLATEGTFGDRVLLNVEMVGDHNSYSFHPHAIWHEMHTYFGIIIYNPEDPEIFE